MSKSPRLSVSPSQCQPYVANLKGNYLTSRRKILEEKLVDLVL